MFGLKRIFKFAAVAAAALIVFACADEKKAQVIMPTKDNMIPDNALVAVKVQPEQLFDKAMGDDDSYARQLWDEFRTDLLGEIKDEDGNEALAEIVRGAIKDPSTLGVSLKEPLVLSVSGDLSEIMSQSYTLEVCLVAILDNRDAFVKAIDTVFDYANKKKSLDIAKETINDTYYYDVFSDKKGALDICISKEAAVFRLSVAAHNAKFGNINETMFTLFQNGGPENKDGIKAFMDSKSDVAVWANLEEYMDIFLPILKQASPEVYAMFEESMPDYNGAAVVADLELKDGQTVLDFSIFGSEEMKANAVKYCTTASDKFFEYVPSSSVFVGNFALKDFAGLIDGIGNMNEDLGEQLDALMMMAGIDDDFLAGLPGVITFAVSGEDADTLDVPHFFAGMECDRHVWEYLENLLRENAYHVGNNTYNIEDEFLIKYKDDAIMMYDVNCPLGGFEYSSYADDIENGGFVFNVAALPYDVLEEMAEEVDYYMSVNELLGYFSSLVVVPSSDFMTATVTLNMNDEEHNLLEKLIAYGIEQAYEWR